MREVCQLPTISTQVRIDSKLKRPQRRADAWKQNAATKARIADVPTSEKRFCCHGAPTSKLRTKTSVMPIAASTSTVAYRSSRSRARWRGVGQRRGHGRRLGAGDRQRLALLEQLAGEVAGRRRRGRHRLDAGVAAIRDALGPRRLHQRGRARPSGSTAARSSTGAPARRWRASAARRRPARAPPPSPARRRPAPCRA